MEDRPPLSAISATLTTVEQRALRLSMLPEKNGIASLMHAAIASQPAANWCSVAEFDWVLGCLDRRSLLNHNQPNVDVRAAEIHAYEALIRASGPKCELIGAGELVHAARQLDVLLPFDQQSRSSALLGLENFVPAERRLFINVLPAALLDPRSLSTTSEAPEKTPFQPSDIAFELVESDPVDRELLLEAVTITGEWASGLP